MARPTSKSKLQEIMGREGLTTPDLEELMGVKLTDSPKDVRTALAFLQNLQEEREPEAHMYDGQEDGTPTEEPVQAEPTAIPSREVQMVKVAEITSAGNVRHGVGDVKGLTESMAAIGLLNPVTASVGPAGWVLVDGHRRLQAAVELGWDTIPVTEVPRPATSAALTLWQLLNNSGEPLTPLEEAEAISQILGSGEKITQSELAKKLGKTQGWISQRLMLVKLPDEVKEAVQSGEIRPATAVEIRHTPEMLEEVKGKSLQEVRDLVRPKPEIPQEVADRLAAIGEAPEAGELPDAGDIGDNAEAGPADQVESKGKLESPKGAPKPYQVAVAVLKDELGWLAGSNAVVWAQVEEQIPQIAKALVARIWK